MYYRSIADLNADIRRWVPELLPHHFDIVAGIPRSGLLAANLLSLHLNLPMADVEGLCQGRLLSWGSRYKARPPDLQRQMNVLVLDDSTGSGSQMARVREKIMAANLPHRFCFGAVYTTVPGIKVLDIWHSILDGSRAFEWNLMHHGVLTESCVDIDGILCRDPTAEENDDGPAYVEFQKTVKPLIVPKRVIGWLVTCRLEKYRGLTEEWLKANGIQFNHLVMLNLPDKATRVALSPHANFKAAVYRSVDGKLFIESSPKQAQKIASLTGRPVICPAANLFYDGTLFYDTQCLAKKFVNTASRGPSAAFTRTLRFLKRKTLGRLTATLSR